jgi:16S rRNA (guanine527-N7)-methyltransferase
LTAQVGLPMRYNADRMNSARIRALLYPFLGKVPLSDRQFALVSAHLELLLKWNARINLTAVRDPEEIVTRHFGESLFAARHIFPGSDSSGSLIDVGSGAGFPGIPIAIWAPKLKVTLIEAQQKKAVFLREVLRTLQLSNAEVVQDRAENLHVTADVVTLRAVEQFKEVLTVAAGLVAKTGRLALLIGMSQSRLASSLLPEFTWQAPVSIPLSRERALLIGEARP